MTEYPMGKSQNSPKRKGKKTRVCDEVKLADMEKKKKDKSKMFFFFFFCCPFSGRISFLFFFWLGIKNFQAEIIAFPASVSTLQP